MREPTAPTLRLARVIAGERRGRARHRGAPPTSPGTVTDAVAATDKGRHKGDYSDDVQAGERRQRFFLADGFFAAGFLDDLDFFLGGSLGSASPSAGATTVLMTPKR